jgi:hypothetical protein
MRLVSRLTILLAALCCCSACSVKIVPQPTATALLNPADNSLTETHDGIAITARLDQLSLQPYQLVDNLSAFHLTIDNQTGEQVTFPAAGVVLKDAAGRQYRSITPERVLEIVSKDTVYLIPYPYVGYYYLEDQKEWESTQAMASSLPYYAEYHPQDIFVRALPAGPVLPRAKVAGVVYFIAELTGTEGFELLVYPNSQLQGEPRYRFPFNVEK